MPVLPHRLNDDWRRVVEQMDFLDVPGMRAGRLDRVVFLPPPQADARRLSLVHYGARPEDLDELVHATEGLTGAFLRELVARTHQAPDIPVQEHVRQLRCMAPKAFSAPRMVQAAK